MKPVTGLSVARIIIGLVAILRPGSITAMFRLDRAEDPASEYITRMFGAREVALGAVTLAAPEQAYRRTVALGIAVDATDVAAGALIARSGRADAITSAALIAPGVSAVAAGLYGLIIGRR